jgi:hypothetical protein
MSTEGLFWPTIVIWAAAELKQKIAIARNNKIIIFVLFIIFLLLLTVKDKIKKIPKGAKQFLDSLQPRGVCKAIGSIRCIVIIIAWKFDLSSRKQVNSNGAIMVSLPCLNKSDSNICYQLKCASVDRVAKLRTTGSKHHHTIPFSLSFF